MNKLAVFGNPIAHSLSPQLHAEFARPYNITIDYQKIFTPLGEFKKTVDAFRASGGVGANITAPFKLEAYEYCDVLTERAKQTHTVNTFIFKNNLCIGDNTDGIGFINDLAKKQFNCFEKNILILGAGGATQGILGELILQNPNKIYIENRTPEKIKNIIDFFGAQFTTHQTSLVATEVGAQATTPAYEFLPSFLLPPNSGALACARVSIASNNHYVGEKIDLLINATSMNFQTDCELQLDLSNTVCYDLNYGERHNTFSDWAKKNDARVIYDGLGMLVEQGSMSFFQWFDKMPKNGCNITL